jgi:hypothetical protein
MLYFKVHKDKADSPIFIFNNKLNFQCKLNFTKVNSTLSKQLEREKISRKKLEQYIRKNNKTIDIATITTVDNESTI